MPKLRKMRNEPGGKEQIAVFQSTAGKGTKKLTSYIINSPLFTLPQLGTPTAIL